MVGNWLNDGPTGSTPIDEEEAQALIPTHITTTRELNAWEYANIIKAQTWALGNRRRQILTEKFTRRLHHAMFDQTWEWAGTYRQTGKNIGVPAYRISTDVTELLRDTEVQIEMSVFDIDEIAVRLHHRMVQIHPFPNGNGRHARLLADVLIYNRRGPTLRWGGSQLMADSPARDRYLHALRQADQFDYAPLLELARN